MSVKRVGPWALVLIFLGTATVRGQDPHLPAGAPEAAGPAGPGGPAPGGLSNWITYSRPGCCGPLTDAPMVQYELYVRSGVTLPVAGKIFDDALEPGWLIQGGARALLFNRAMDKAWTADLSLSHMNNNGHRTDVRATLRDIFVTDANGLAVRIPELSVSVGKLDRTFVNFALGREWYLWGTAAEEGQMWRAGLDTGWRYGTARLELNELPHRNDVMGGAFLAVHTDVEVPWKCWMLQFGLRTEWDYIWSDILQKQNNSDVMDVNLLLTFGVRY